MRHDRSLYIGNFKENLKIHTGVPPLLSFPPPLPCLHLPVPLPSYIPLALEVGPLSAASGSGERCKLSQRGLWQSPSRNRFWCLLALKCDIWWLRF